MIKECPGLLETFSYIFYFPSAIVGPSFEFSDYRNFVYTLGDYKNFFSLNHAIKASMIELTKGLICMGAYVVLKTPFDNEFLITEEFGNYGIIYKVKY